jgi:hypothetical protein
MACIYNYMFGPAEQPAPAAPKGLESFGATITTDLKDFWVTPHKKVMENPLTALLYSLTIKTVCSVFALIFPLLSYIAIGISIGIIDREIIENRKQFFEGLLAKVKECSLIVLNTIFMLKPAAQAAR